MRVTIHLLVGFLTLIIVGAAWTNVAGLTSVAPIPVAVVCLYLGITSSAHLARAVFVAIVLGYINDVLVGSPAGLLALTGGLVCVAGHLASGRYLLGNFVAAAIASFLAALAFLGITILIARAVGLTSGQQLTFDPSVLGLSATATAVVGAAQFFVHRRIDARLARTQRDRDAALEGVVAS